jgi:hypothetical protein
MKGRFVEDWAQRSLNAADMLELLLIWAFCDAYRGSIGRRDVELVKMGKSWKFVIQRLL